MVNFFKDNGGLSIKSIEKNNLSYFVGYIIVFIWVYSYFLPNAQDILNNDSLTILGKQKSVYLWLFSCSLIATIFNGTNYVPKTIYSVVIAIICFFSGTVFTEGRINTVLQIVMAITIGHIFASVGFAFFMIFNNSEKLYSMVFAVTLPNIITLINVKLHVNGYNFVLPVLLIVLLICSLFFRIKSKEIVVVKKEKFPKKTYSLMSIAFVAMAIGNVIAPMTLFYISSYTQQHLLGTFTIGIFIGALLVIILQRGIELSIFNIFNISFGLLAIGFMASLAVNIDNKLIYISAISFGIAYSILLINIYYLAGFMTKRFQNIVFYRVGIILSSVNYFIGFGAIFLLYKSIFILSLISGCIVIIFLMLSQLFNQFLFSGEWIDDTYRQDVTFTSRLEVKLQEYYLSPREQQVCMLLLQGYTLKQISIMLSVAYSTVNTYCTTVYRKLNINSRTELMVLLFDFLPRA